MTDEPRRQTGIRQIAQNLRNDIHNDIMNLKNNNHRNRQDIDISKKTTIRQRFFNITAIYTVTTIFTTLFLTFFFTNQGTGWLVGQGNDQQLGLASLTIAPLITDDAIDNEAIKTILTNTAQTAKGTHYVVILNDADKEIIGWHNNSTNVPYTKAPMGMSYNMTSFYQRVQFTAANNQVYYIQTAYDIMALYSIVFSSYVSGLVFIFFILTGYAIIVWSIYKKSMVIPIEDLSNTAVSILESGDLTIEIPVTRENELGQLAKIINANNNKQRQLLTDIKNCCDSFMEINKTLGNCGNNIANNATSIQDNAQNSTDMMNALLSSFTNVGNQLQELNGQSERGSTTVYEMAQVNQEVSNNIKAMGDSVKESISAINQMSASIQQNASHIDQLNGDINEVNHSMIRLDESIANEERNAKETLALSKQLAEDATNGMESLNQTIYGIDKIKNSSDHVSAIITELGHHAKNIGNVVKVIDDLNNQTNLLALNAAIIAAQAGEHGRGFAVVADEVGALASRTKSSTKEINDLIISIQQAAQEAVTAMMADQQVIADGIALSRQTADSFTALMASAQQTATQSQQMSDATIEQANEVRSVTAAISNIAETIRQINDSSHLQAEEANSMTKASKQMDYLNMQVASSSSEQARSSQEVLSAISNINNKTAIVNKFQQEQTNNTSQAVSAVTSIAQKAVEQQHASEELKNTIDNINTQIALLADYLGECRF